MNNDGILHMFLWFLTAFFLAVVVQIIVVYILIENQFLLKSALSEIESHCGGKSVQVEKGRLP